MEDTSIDFLFFHDLRLLEALKCDDELLNPLIDLVWLSREDMLEVLIGSTVDLLSALGRADLAREQDSVLGNQVLDLVLDLLRNFDQYVMGFRREVRMHFEL